MSALRSTQRSPLDWLACSHCHSPFSSLESPSTSCWISSCTHALCANCLFSPQAVLPDSLQPVQGICPPCGETCTVVPLSSDTLEGSGVAHFFKPLATLTSEVGEAAAWQMEHLIEQLEYFKGKCGEQKKTLGKVAGQLKELQGLRGQLDQLAAENASLRSQLANSASHAWQAQQSARDGGYAMQEKMDMSSASSGQGAQKRKRAPDRAIPTLRSAGFGSNSRAPSRSASTALRQQLQLPLPPSRLSFTPAQSSETRERKKLSSRQGAARAEEGKRQKPVEGESVKQRLQQFPYNPSRTSQRLPPPSAQQPPPSPQPRFDLSASQSFPARPSHQGHYSQHHEAHLPLHPSSDPSPFLFDPQQHDAPHPDDLESTPPPPVPSSSRHAFQPQQPSGASPFVSARQLQQNQQQQHQRFHSSEQQQPHHPPPTPSFSQHSQTPRPQFQPHSGAAPFAPSRTPAPSLSSALPIPTPSQNSHRVPFRPAGVSGGRAGGGTGGGFRYG
ncbi:hypothetical protein JCM8547_003238 [Rhodosporidiobolus lusitaniae]